MKNRVKQERKTKRNKYRNVKYRNKKRITKMKGEMTRNRTHLRNG